MIGQNPQFFKTQNRFLGNQKATRPAPSVEVEVFRWLLDRIDPKDWGIDRRTKSNRTAPVTHAHTKQRILASINGDPTSSGRVFVKSITHGQLWQHAAGQTTLLFSGYGRRDRPESLAKIDVDTKRRPNPDQARQFLADYQHQRPQLSGIFVENSGGGGAHGYFVLQKGAHPTDLEAARATNQALNALQKDVRRVLKEGHRRGLYTDVSDVEIKGHCPEVEFHQGRAVTMKCGSLAKIPVTALDRPHEVMGMARVTASYCLGLGKLPVTFDEPVITVFQMPAGLHNRYNPGTRERVGSTGNHPLPRDVVSNIKSTVMDIARKYLVAELRTSGAEVVTVLDVAIWLAIVGWITSEQGDDKAMPSRRIGAIWTALKEAGLVERGYCPKRCAAIRNHLSDQGLIDWYEDRYWVSDQPSKFCGTPQKGKCAQYSICSEVMQELGLGSVGQQRESTVGTTLPATLNPTFSQASEPPKPFRGVGIRPVRLGWASEYYGMAA